MLAQGGFSTDTSRFRIIYVILSILLGGLFLFSGVSKIMSFDAFAVQVMDIGVASLEMAGILSRILIGIEILLGIYLCAQLFLRPFTLPAVMAILLLFTGQLTISVLQRGNNGNCGCFGEIVYLTPVAAIAKNAVAIVITLFLYQKYRPKFYPAGEWIAAIGGMAALAAPFLIFPLSQTNKPEVISQAIDFTPLYHSANADNVPPDEDLTRGKHIVAFLSLTCDHCKKAAYTLQVIYRHKTELPIFLILNGHREDLPAFLKETQADRVPYVLFRGPGEFVRMAGLSVPAIYWVNNGIAERKSTVLQLAPEEMTRWLME